MKKLVLALTLVVPRLLLAGSQCPPGFPVDCGPVCCPANDTCNPQNTNLCCTPAFPVPCATTCCQQGQTCDANGACGQSCDPSTPQRCGPTTCCGATDTCNALNSTLCCDSQHPVQCQNTCCPANFACTPDGSNCISLLCPAEAPVDCGNDNCCPAGDRCASVMAGDVITNFCCVDVPPDNCGACAASGIQTAVATDGTQRATGRPARAASKAGGGKCKRSAKANPFDTFQVTASEAGTSFDNAQHLFSVAFVLGKGKKQVALKEPIVVEDSNDQVLSVVVPPFLLQNASHGRANVFLVTDGVMSTECLARVRIGQLPRPASRHTGLVTMSWLRGHQNLYGLAKPMLQSAAAAPFVNSSILSQVDAAQAKTGDLVSGFSVQSGRKNPLFKTAMQSDRLVTAILKAGQKVADPSFAAASGSWLKAMSGARDGNDATLMAAEATYAHTLLSVSGSSAQSVAKFVTGAGAVTTTAMAAGATMFGGGHGSSPKIDAQATANAVCGATLRASATITGITILSSCGGTCGNGVPAYGKMLVMGSAHTAASTRTNYGMVDLPHAKLCTCSGEATQTTISISITIIIIEDTCRQQVPQVCLPDDHQMMHGTTTTTMPMGLCGNGTKDPGEECDPGLPNAGGCGAGKTCEACRCVGTGDVRVTLIWDTTDDLDLHVIDPSNAEIYYGNRNSASGGALDVDSNAGCGTPQPHPVENIFWANTAPAGTYTVKVDYFKFCGSGSPATIPFTVKTLVGGQERSFPGTVSTPDSCGACSSCNTCSMVTTFTR